MDIDSKNGSSFNQEFCTHLEYHLCRTFENSDNQELKFFWCDGVSMEAITEIELTPKRIYDSRKIETMAWIGKDGQDEYKMTIHFGNLSLSRYAQGNKLTDCLPSEEAMDWINIDTQKKTIEIRLC